MPASTAIKATPPSNENADAGIERRARRSRGEIASGNSAEENLAENLLLLDRAGRGPIFCQQGGIRSARPEIACLAPVSH